MVVFQLSPDPLAITSPCPSKFEINAADALDDWQQPKAIRQKKVWPSFTLNPPRTRIIQIWRRMGRAYADGVRRPGNHPQILLNAARVRVPGASGRHGGGSRPR